VKPLQYFDSGQSVVEPNLNSHADDTIVEMDAEAPVVGNGTEFFAKLAEIAAESVGLELELP
jgi:hypothetical protein